MARKSKQETAKEKAAKQKKIAIGGGVVLVALLAIQVPRTMKMMNGHPKAPVVATTSADGTTTTTAAAAVDPTSLAAPTLAGSPTTTTPTETTSNLVASVPLEVDAGQLREFQRFASKDPFQSQVSSKGAPAGGSSGSSGSSGSGKSGGSSGSSGGTKTLPTVTKSSPSPSSPTVTPSAPAAPTAGVISLNGELTSVSPNADFPLSGATFQRAGSLFHLIALTSTTAKVAIAGGSYANGAGALTLHLKTPVTLQNTADGSKYTLILEPPSTPVGGSSPASTTTTPAAPVVPSSGSGG